MATRQVHRYTLLRSSLVSHQSLHRKLSLRIAMMNWMRFNSRRQRIRARYIHADAIMKRQQRRNMIYCVFSRLQRISIVHHRLAFAMDTVGRRLRRNRLVYAFRNIQKFSSELTTHNLIEKIDILENNNRRSNLEVESLQFQLSER